MNVNIVMLIVRQLSGVCCHVQHYGNLYYNYTNCHVQHYGNLYSHKLLCIALKKFILQ